MITIVVVKKDGKFRVVFTQSGETQDIIEGSKVQVINLIAQILTDRLEEP